MITWQIQAHANEELEAFLRKHSHRSIFQTTVWQQVLCSIQGVVHVAWVVATDGGQIVGAALVTTYRLPLRTVWLHVGGGPLFAEEYQQEGLHTWTSWIRAYAKQVGAVWTRIEPSYVDATLTEVLPVSWRRTPTSYQPEASLWLDLTQTEEELLQQMKQKGRYNIRLAQKKGVEVVMWKCIQGTYIQIAGTATEISDPLTAFYTLFEETTSRDGFSGRSKEYYATVMDALGEEGVLSLAVHEGDILAGAICSMKDGIGVYIFGASTTHKRALMAPYAVQWAAIREAKNRGMHAYDFLGISPPDVPNHPWQHVTDFKSKFGGEARVYLGAWMLVHRPLIYTTIHVLKWIRNCKKKLVKK